MAIITADSSAITADSSAVSADGGLRLVSSNKGGGRGSARSRKRYIERDGNILLFSDASAADAWVAAEPKPEAPQPKKTAKPKAKPQPEKVEEPQVIDVQAIMANRQRLAREFAMQQTIDELLRMEKMGYLLMLSNQVREWQDEEDVVLLLLAA